MHIVAVDTETVAEDRPWSVQYADAYSPLGVMVYCEDTVGMRNTRILLQSHDTLTVLHNAKFDIRVLDRLGIHPARYECTMQMAYLLGEPRLSLKVLAYRMAGMVMPSYLDVTREATQEKALEYLQCAVAMDWPDPDPTIVTKADGTVRLSFPRNVKGKIVQLLKKHDVDPAIDLYDKWHKMELASGRGMVEEAFGILPRAYLDEVDRQEAEEYAKRDAEATFAIYPHLHSGIEHWGLQEVLERDMDCVPMLVAMEDNGVLLDRAELEALGADLDVLAEDTQTDINFLAGHYVNPRSSQQVVALLQDEGIFTDMESSTDASVLDQFREHTIVNKIQDYRAYSKLQSTYVRGLLASVREDRRVHTQFSMARTDTGRWASKKPNLQNLPVRTELGRRIRKAFVSERGEE